MALKGIVPKEMQEVRKVSKNQIDEIQRVIVPPKSSIPEHGHQNQWEVWIRFSHKEVYVCLKGETHYVETNTKLMLVLMAIKGHEDCSYEELKEIFGGFGFKVFHGSLIA